MLNKGASYPLGKKDGKEVKPRNVDKKIMRA